MEAYFYQDPGIQEHIDQIVEKLFAVCLLKGAEADAEFQRGLKSAQKLVTALESLSSLSEEEIYSGVRQIIEQRLPDMRVIENFPVFNGLMDRMLTEAVHVSMGKSLQPDNSFVNNSSSKYDRSVAIIQSTSSTSESRVNIIDGRLDVLESNQVKIPANQNQNYNVIQDIARTDPEVLILKNQKLEQSQEQESEQVYAIEQQISLESKQTERAQSVINHQTEKETEKETEQKSLPRSELQQLITKLETEPEKEPKKKAEIEIKTGQNIEPEEAKEPYSKVKSEMEGANSKTVPGAIRRTVAIPAKAQRLAAVLTYIFPKAPVRWNIALAGYNFLAQVENVLIYIIGDLNHSEVVNKMQKEGWITILFAEDDLGYPRRLEREIKRSLQRKNSKIKPL